MTAHPTVTPDGRGRPYWSGRFAVAASALVYLGITAVIGRDILAGPTRIIASDTGDPVLTAVVLMWNATHVPGIGQWWNFPSFYPAAGTTTFTEHLLGLGVLSTPLYWLTGSAPAAYNLTLLLTYPLCALAMYALAHRLTRSHGAAFLAGLAFGLAPYRIGHLPQIQVLSLFWAPLALLGLHAWRETGRRRWLVVFGACWALQTAANTYMLVFFSLLVAAWVLWFIVIPGRWRDLVAVCAAGLVASLPLLPLLYGYITVHAWHGLSRSRGEIAFYGADVAAVLCAPPSLTFWGWLRIGCRPEGELFPGAGLLALCLVMWIAVRRWSRRPPVMVLDPPALRVATQVVMALAGVYALVLLSVLVNGPWRIEWGALRISVSSVAKPLSTLAALLLVVLLLSRPFRAAVARSSTVVFYAVATVVAWVLAWGPAPRLLGSEVLYMAPYRWLLQVPGVDGVRVPARFWMIVTLCLPILLALVAGAWVKGRARRSAAAMVAAGAVLLAMDGWGVIPVAPLPAAVADAGSLRGRVVLELPLGNLFDDVAAQYRAVTGGWSTVNGYSGYEPAHYEALRVAAAAEDPVLFAPFRARSDLDVLVAAGAAQQRAFVERQPGAVLHGSDASFARYRLPRAGTFAAPVAAGARRPIERVTVSCNASAAEFLTDGRTDTDWHCGPQQRDEQVTIDLGTIEPTGAVVHGIGPFRTNFPRELVIETSVDGRSWRPAWRGRAHGTMIAAAMQDGGAARLVFPFEPRPARYVRLRQVGRDDNYYWSVADLEIRSGPPGSS